MKNDPPPPPPPPVPPPDYVQYPVGCMVYLAGALVAILAGVIAAGAVMKELA